MITEDGMDTMAVSRYPTAEVEGVLSRQVPV
jgi:hypothetical protein